MLRITIPAAEWYDERTEEFFNSKEQTIQLEHSLLSLSKWESKWKKPFLDKEHKKTYAESIDYIRCMTLTQNVDPLCYYAINNELMEQISNYIEDSMTATWFSEHQADKRPGRTSHEVITAELIYYWMVALQIPFECQKWHLNRLFTLIQVCNIKNTKPTPMTKREIMKRNRELNAARRQKLNTKG